MRRVLGAVYLLIARIMLGLKVSDINCGFKIYTKNTARHIFEKQTMDDWSFDAEDLFLTKNMDTELKRYLWSGNINIRPK